MGMIKKYISPYGNAVKILHFPGDSDMKKQACLNSFNYKPIVKPDNVEIITTAFEVENTTLPLLTQLKNSKIPFLNSTDNHKIITWNNRNKIQYIYDTLQEVSSDYCLILDSRDVAIASNLSDILSLYESYGVDVLYNAGDALHPNIEIEKIPNRNELGEFKYFNAGCCIGKTDTLKELYKEALDIIAETNLEECPYSNSEQYFLRQVYANHLNDGKMGIDYKCRIFQVWHNLKKSIQLEPSGNIFYNLKTKYSVPLAEDILTPQPAVETDVL